MTISDSVRGEHEGYILDGVLVVRRVSYTPAEARRASLALAAGTSTERETLEKAGFHLADERPGFYPIHKG